MRRLIVLLVPLAVLVGIFVVVDRVAVGVAEGRIAAEIQRKQELGAPPVVQVHGFPFLTQVVRGRYKQVDADLREPDVGDDLAIDRLQVRLSGVRAKLAPLVAGDVSSIPVDSATAVATVSFRALNAAARENLPKGRSTVKFGPGPDGQLAVSGTYATSAFTARLDTRARLVARRGRLVVELPAGALDDIPQAFRPQVESLLATASELPELPLGFRATDVTVGPAAISVRARSTTLDLSRSADLGR